MPSPSWKRRWTPIFEQHPDAKIVRSLPGLGLILGARVLGEFGDDPTRFVDAANRRVYAGAALITRASGRSRVVLMRPPSCAARSPTSKPTATRSRTKRLTQTPTQVSNTQAVVLDFRIKSVESAGKWIPSGRESD
jgi:hypothetical protein